MKFFQQVSPGVFVSINGHAGGQINEVGAGGYLWEPVHRHLEWPFITFVEPCTILGRKDIHVQCVPTT